MSDELEWIDKTVETTIRYLWHGTVAGEPRTRWNSPESFDTKPEVVAHQITETTTGTVLGHHPELGPVTLTGGQYATTEVRTVVEHAPVFKKDPAVGSQTEEP